MSIANILPDMELAKISQALKPKQEVTGLLSEFSQMSDFGACMMPLLMALGYRGDLRHIAEALPHFAETLDITGLRNMMANISYNSRLGQFDIQEIDPRLMPCLFVPKHRGAMVMLKRKLDSFIVFNGETSQVERLPMTSLKGTAYFFELLDLEEQASTQNRLGWFRMVAERFRKIFSYIMLVTFIITILQVTTPLFVMSVYDRVVGSKSISTLTYLLMGISGVIFFDWVLRKFRSKMLMYVGTRMDSIVSNAIFLRILSLTPSFTERAPIGSQVARI